MSRKTATILLSRQPLGACGTTPWVQATVQAVAWVKMEGLTLASSIGMQTWELLCATASLAGVPQIVVVPCRDPREFARLEIDIRRNYQLGRECDCRPAFGRDRREQLAHRDRTVVDLADLLIPLSVRHHGSLHTLLDAARSARPVVEQFHIDYDVRSTPMKYSVPADDLNPAVDSLSSRLLIHWTRARYAPWPHERPLDYYEHLLGSDRCGHTARDTLRHIIDSRRLLATGRHMPLGVRTVSFSALPPREALPLMRWRSRYCEMSFEPYGIGIAQDAAVAHGIQPVVYYDPRRDETPDPDSLWRSQSVGLHTDWTQEHEHRHLGDLELRTLPPQSVCLFCLTPTEAATLEASTGLRCLPLLAHDPGPVRSIPRHTAAKRIRARPE